MIVAHDRMEIVFISTSTSSSWLFVFICCVQSNGWIIFRLQIESTATERKKNFSKWTARVYLHAKYELSIP